MRKTIHNHADAVVRGDMETVIGDFEGALRPDVPQLAQALPLPVIDAEVVRVDVGEEESIALIRYAGEDEDVTIRMRWREIDGRPLIVHAEPAA